MMEFQQPARVVPAEYIPMTEVGQEIATRVREIFYAYNQRKSDDNRSAQVHLGPSEIGTPCDRRLVMTLLGRPAVNPGGDGWAAWMGTQGHKGMAEIFEWADAGTGRFAVETPLAFPSELVPRGTGDLLDRTVAGFIDWKFMGEWSLKKLRTMGPSETYRVQIHTYAYGARLRGEKVKHVAIVGLPRSGSSLDDMYVWSEPYDRTVAERALKRVASIKREADRNLAAGYSVLETVEAFPTAKDCTYCPFHLSGSKDIEHGCKGVR